MSFVYNHDDTNFNIGDAVWTANTIRTNATCFEGEVIGILSDDTCKGTGKHYIIYVPTGIDDDIMVRRHNYCFRSAAHYDLVKRHALLAEKAFQKKLRELKL